VTPAIRHLIGEMPEWYKLALCAQTDPDLFFPDKGGCPEPAKRICRRCEVRIECLEYAVSNNVKFGIWGGLSEKERNQWRKQQTRQETK